MQIEICDLEFRIGKQKIPQDCCSDNYEGSMTEFHEIFFIKLWNQFLGFWSSNAYGCYQSGL